MEQKNETVSLEQYEALLQMLEEERFAHARTKSQLMETEDKLEFAQGEIEILTKQIEREKLQFEKTFGVLKDKALKESCKNVELENKCQDMERRVDQREDVVSVQDDAIQALNRKLQQQKELHDREMYDVKLRKEQEQYINRVMQQHDRKSTVKKSSKS